MNRTLTWFKKIWQTYAKENQKELGFDRSFMVYVFKAHTTDNVNCAVGNE